MKTRNTHVDGIYVLKYCREDRPHKIETFNIKLIEFHPSKAFFQKWLDQVMDSPCKVRDYDPLMVWEITELPPTCTVRFHLFYQPGTSHIDSLVARAEKALERGLIKEMPTIEVLQIDGNWKFILKCQNQDKAFWLGFHEGRDFAINNRQITLGVD